MITAIFLAVLIIVLTAIPLFWIVWRIKRIPPIPPRAPQSNGHVLQQLQDTTEKVERISAAIGEHTNVLRTRRVEQMTEDARRVQLLEEESSARRRLRLQGHEGHPA